MRPCFFCTIPKDDSIGYRNEDAAYWVKNSNAFAISDGASVSFDSYHWARILTRKYVKSPNVDINWFDEAIETFQSIYNREQLSWSAQGSFDRGSFSTLLGVSHYPDTHTVNLTAIGDTVAVLVKGDDILDSFPLNEAEQFNTSPQLISTNSVKNEFMNSPEFMESITREWRLDMENAYILCMTDALAQWFLYRKNEAIPPHKQLIEILSKEKFREFVTQARLNGEMRVDDTTLLVLSNDKLSSDQ